MIPGANIGLVVQADPKISETFMAGVSTDVSGIPEVIQNGINGLLVRPGDATALAVAISRVLNDAALRKRLGKAGRHTVATTFWNETCPAFLLYCRRSVRVGRGVGSFS